MNNTQISLIAKNYADALVKLCKDQAMDCREILNSLLFIKDTCKQSTDLKTILDNPSVSDDVKCSIIDEVFKNSIDNHTIEFLKILIEKKRFNEFEGIIAAFSDETDKINNIQRIEVTSAIDLNDDLKQRIKEKLENRLNKTVITEWIVNEDIIGGLVVQINDDVIDSSLKNKLENLSKNII